MLHCADISHPGKPWNIHYTWTESLMEEYFKQGEKEKELGLPCSPLCDRDNTLVAESQIGEPTESMCDARDERWSFQGSFNTLWNHRSWSWAICWIGFSGRCRYLILNFHRRRFRRRASFLRRLRRPRPARPMSPMLSRTNRPNRGKTDQRGTDDADGSSR